MTTQNKLSSVLTAVTVSTLVAGQAFASGYEKTLQWSGKNVGAAGAVVGSVKGSESIYFNPAGLAGSTGDQKGDVALNFSPTWNQYQGPITAANQQVTSGTRFAPVFGATASYKILENLGVGVGAYVSGGNRAKYDLTLAPGITPTYRGDLDIFEVALGAGYEIIPGLRIGGAWRIVRAGGTLELFAPLSTTSYLGLKVDNATGTKYNGFKLGVEYTPVDSAWGVGAVYRNSVDFNATGPSSGTLFTLGAASTPVTGTDASVTGTFPDQINIGGYYDVSPKAFRVLAQYDYTNYAKSSQLGVAGKVGIASFTAVNQSWKPQHSGRLGVEWMATESTTLRAGYIYTSQVTPNAQARAIFPPPGPGHSFTLGAGMALTSSISADSALEYMFTNGSVTTADFLQGGAVPGDYSLHVLALHAGLTYRF